MMQALNHVDKENQVPIAWHESGGGQIKTLRHHSPRLILNILGFHAAFGHRLTAIDLWIFAPS